MRVRHRGVASLRHCRRGRGRTAAASLRPLRPPAPSPGRVGGGARGRRRGGGRHPPGRGEVEEAGQRGRGLGGDPVHLREGRRSQGGRLLQQPAEEGGGRLGVAEGPMGALMAEAQQTGEGPEIVAGGDREQDAGQLEGVEGLAPPEAGGDELRAEGEVERRAVPDQLGALAEAGQLSHHLHRAGLTGQVRGADPGQPLDPEGHRDARVGEELQLADGAPVETEPDRPDLDDALGLGREAGGLEVERHELGGHHAAGGGTER